MEDWEADASILPGDHPGLSFSSGGATWAILSLVGDYVFHLPSFEILFRQRMRLCLVHLRRMAAEMKTVAEFCQALRPQTQASASLAEETSLVAFLVLARSVIISFGVVKAFVEDTVSDGFNTSSWQSHRHRLFTDWHNTILGSQMDLLGHVNDWTLLLMKLLLRVKETLGAFAQRNTEQLLAKSFVAIRKSTCALAGLIGLNSVCSRVVTLVEEGLETLSYSSWS